MAGRKHKPGAEVRDQSMTIRWTPGEKKKLEAEQKRRDIEYLVDVPRTLALLQLDLQEAFADKADLLEKAREFLGCDTVEDVVKKLALEQLERISSAL